MRDLQNQIADLSPAELALLESRLRDLVAPAPAAESIPRTANRETGPLSFTQQRIWFLEQLNPVLAAYNRLVVYRLKGSLNLRALEDSLTNIIRRHEILRTAFSTTKGQPLQVIFPDKRFVLQAQDLSASSKGSQEDLGRRLAREEGQEPFDLEAGMLVRAKVLRLSATEHLLLITFHHIAIDGWSIPIFMEELLCCYEAYAAGAVPAQAALPIQYADFAVWQRQRLQGPLLEQQLQYWREQLAGAAEEMALPTDHPRPAVQSYRGATMAFELGRELVTALKQWSREQGVTLFMSLLAIFQLLLSRYSGAREIVVGTPIANRSRVELEGLIGCFANTLVLRTAIEEEESYRELVRRVREVCLGAYAHQDVPFERLVEELQPERKLSHTPLCQVVFSLEHRLSKELELAGIKWSPVMIETKTSKFDLFLQFHEDESCLRGRLVYNTDLFESDTICYMLRHLEKLLHSALSRPDARLSELEMLLDEERKLLERSNDMDDLAENFAGEGELVDIRFN
jgi:Condensation domain